jgi:hypothetical protein
MAVFLFVALDFRWEMRQDGRPVESEMLTYLPNLDVFLQLDQSWRCRLPLRLAPH